MVLPAAQKQDVLPNFELINLTGDSLILGYQKINPESNDRQAIVSPIDKQQWIQDVSANNVAKVIAGTNAGILYILHDISLGRVNEGNYVRIKAAIYTGNQQGFLLNTEVDTLLTDKTVNIIAINRLVGEAMASSLSGAVKKEMQDQSVQRLTRDQAIRQEKERDAFIGRTFTPTGIYMNYEEFKSGRPSFEQLFIKINQSGLQLTPDGSASDSVNESSDNYSLTVHSFGIGDTALHPVIPWGVVVNNELYVFQSGKLYAVESFGNNLAFSKFIDPEVRKNNASFWRMTVGDNLSGRYTNVFDNVNTLVLDNYRNQKLNGEARKINADTGTPEF